MLRTVDAYRPAAHVSNVRFEHLREPLGIGTPHPRLSWIVTSEAPGWRQVAYELEVYELEAYELKAYEPAGEGLLTAGLSTTARRGATGRIESGESVLVPWPFAPLAARERLAVRVRAGEDGGQPSDWSELAPVEAGLLAGGDWQARFVTPAWEEGLSAPQPGPLLRQEFDVRSGVRAARLYATALGVYAAQVNGTVAGDHVMAPGWTSYGHRLRYQTFDVTRLLHEGRNALGAMLGDGWYRGRLSFGGGRRNLYGDRLALMAQLEIDYADGTTERVVTDERWRAARGPITGSDIYDGESYDARLEWTGWAEAGFDDGNWLGVVCVERDLATLVAPSGPPVRRTETVTPVEISTSPAGRTIVDFGQNLVGRLRINVQGPAGQTVTLRHAEVLEGGELCTRTLRSALATDHYTLRGAGVETWEPRFTFHGFRYAEVEGWPGTLTAGDIRANVCYSDLERTGWFECSDPLLNRLHENVVWSMRGNFLDVPTDCPQRDERRGLSGSLPPADGARLPLVALPRDHGRDDDLGAVGQPAPGRLGESGRDDFV